MWSCFVQGGRAHAEEEEEGEMNKRRICYDASPLAVAAVDNVHWLPKMQSFESFSIQHRGAFQFPSSPSWRSEGTPTYLLDICCQSASEPAEQNSDRVSWAKAWYARWEKRQAETRRDSNQKLESRRYMIYIYIYIISIFIFLKGG